MKPKVSVIIPIYNTEKYLRRCMDTVLNQTLKEIEIILVDDESPDNAPQLCDAYAQADSRIKVIHKQNGGLGYARNSGLEIAAGEYAAFLDSDDYVAPDMYERLYTAAKAAAVDVAFCGCYFVDGAGRACAIPRPMSNRRYCGEEVRKILFGTLGAPPACREDNVLGMSVWAGIYSLDLIQKEQIRFHSEREYICEDAVFHIDFFRHADSAYLMADPLYYYCSNPGSLSRVFRRDRFEMNKILYGKETQMLRDYGFLEEGKTYIDRMLLAFARVFLTEAAYQLSAKETVDWIRSITDDPLLKQILQEYPYQKNPPKQRLFNTLLAAKSVWPIYGLLKIAAYRKRLHHQIAAEQ